MDIILPFSIGLTVGGVLVVLVVAYMLGGTRLM